MRWALLQWHKRISLSLLVHLLKHFLPIRQFLTLMVLYL